MGDHDHSYKLLFSHPRMVRDLLEGFVREDWLAQLDYASLERINANYMSEDLRERANDVVWRVRWGEGWLYVYLLIEFQSTVDRFMALRLLTYVGLLHQDLIRHGHCTPGRRLPPVLPIVLYNGPARWNAPEGLAALIEPGPRGLERYQPQLQYLLIDQARYADSEWAPLRNLAAALFRLEHSRTAREIDAVLQALIEWLKHPQERGLQRAFAVWIRRVILARLPGGEQLPTVDDLQEMRSMLADRIQEWAEEAKRQGWQEGVQEGRQEGRQEGLQEGLQQGEAILLSRLVRKRFGELPTWAEQRIRGATQQQLEHWGERLMEVDELEAVFSEP